MLKKLSNYQTFGIRRVWLEEFLRNPEEWLRGRNSCGPVQFEAMKRWLFDAELLKKEKRGYGITELTYLFSNLSVDDPLVWGVIWVNLARKSSLIKWYITELEWGRYYSREELLNLMGDKLSLATRKNALQSLCELFKHTPFGELFELGLLVKQGKKVLGIEKRGISLNLKFEILLLLIKYTFYVFNLWKNRENQIFITYRIWGIPEDLFQTLLSDFSKTNNFINYETEPTTFLKNLISQRSKL